jgi:hypothetical protein
MVAAIVVPSRYADVTDVLRSRSATRERQDKNAGEDKEGSDFLTGRKIGTDAAYFETVSRPALNRWRKALSWGTTSGSESSARSS